MAKQNTMDLTQGRPIKQILLFSLPLVMGTLFQQLYSFMDTVMVGRLISEEALAAVGTTYSLNFLTLGFVQGACVGFGIPLAQSIGAKDSEGFKRYFWNGVWLCCILGVVMTVLTYLFAQPLLRMINTPEDILADATGYIRIIFLTALPCRQRRKPRWGYVGFEMSETVRCVFFVENAPLHFCQID